MLLTNLPVENLKDAKRVLRYYVRRWESLKIFLKLVKRPLCISKPWHHLTAEEFQNLLKVAPPRCKAIYALAYGCALREGEIVSLKWDNIDFASGSHGEVRIYNQPVTATTPPFNIKDYKECTIPPPKFVADILTDLNFKVHYDTTENTPYVALNEQQYKTLLAKWKRYKKQKRVWKNRDFQNNTLTTFKRHAAKAGIITTKSLSIKVLRKNCTTNWANRIQNPEAVRKLAGHSDIATITKYCSMLTDDVKAKAAAVIDETLTPLT
jgi:integrase